MAGGPGSIRTTPSDYPVTDEDDTSARSSAYVMLNTHIYTRIDAQVYEHGMQVPGMR